MALSVHAETVNFDGVKAGGLPAEWLAGASGKGVGAMGHRTRRDDEHIAGSGAVGVWTKADSVTAFDDFVCGSTPTR